MFDPFYEYIYHLFQTVDYTAIFVMMLIEASMLPFPSEVPMLAIGIQAAKGTMNPFLGLVISLVAIFIGATANYYIGYFIGDKFFEKYGKYFLIKKHAYHEAKRLYAADANFYTFYGRLIPLVRQLMSLPAGMVHMPYWKFISLTLAGSAIWHIILISMGYLIGDNTELIKSYLTWITLILLLCGLIWFADHHKTLVKKTIVRIKKAYRK